MAVTEGTWVSPGTQRQQPKIRTVVLHADGIESHRSPLLGNGTAGAVHGDLFSGSMSSFDDALDHLFDFWVWFWRGWWVAVGEREVGGTDEEDV